MRVDKRQIAFLTDLDGGGGRGIEKMVKLGRKLFFFFFWWGNGLPHLEIRLVRLIDKEGLKRNGGIVDNWVD